MKTASKFVVAVFCLMVFIPGVASAAICLYSDSSGELSKVTGLVVNGATYDVSFVEGSAGDVYDSDGNGEYDFAFTSQDDAEAALEKLSYIYNMYGNMFTSVYGVSSDEKISLVVAYGINTDDNTVADISLLNYFLVYTETSTGTYNAGDFIVKSKTYGVDNSTAGAASRVYAVFTQTSPVPVPGSCLVLGAGLIGLAGWRRGKPIATA